ncbi:hypothetical protein SDC9_143358 [bioreactor metagenome]|uniref:Uncharacterized protein n=1 Tax=bioreactor metagenome TaxID=1076179 RepID=A0A645E358_9ZZZZ
MPTKSRAGIEGLEPVGLGLRSVDYFPDADAHLVTELGKLVHQPDVHIPVGVLQYFLHLGNCRAGNLIDITGEYGTVDGSNNLSGILADTADNFGGVLGLVDEVARIDTLRGESEIKILSTDKPGTFFQQWLD